LDRTAEEIGEVLLFLRKRRLYSLQPKLPNHLAAVLILLVHSCPPGDEIVHFLFGPAQFSGLFGRSLLQQVHAVTEKYKKKNKTWSESVL
jgi:hypothetical protein